MEYASWFAVGGAAGTPGDPDRCLAGLQAHHATLAASTACSSRDGRRRFFAANAGRGLSVAFTGRPQPVRTSRSLRKVATSIGTGRAAGLCHVSLDSGAAVVCTIKLSRRHAITWYGSNGCSHAPPAWWTPELLELTDFNELGFNSWRCSACGACR